MSHDPDLDNDPRDPDTQAADFFTRPGDFHQVDITIPIDDEPHSLKLGAKFVIKFTPDQKPLIIEVLRQLRGALAARITITRMNQTSESDNDGRNSTPNDAIDNGPPKPTPDHPIGERTPPPPPLSRPWTAKEIDGAIDLLRSHEHEYEHDVDRAKVAAELRVPADQLTPIPMSNGQTAWAHTPPPRTTSVGRHAKPEGAQA